jgi:hypothetical protein
VVVIGCVGLKDVKHINGMAKEKKKTRLTVC